jgi:stage III sporulation protein AA
MLELHISRGSGSSVRFISRSSYLGVTIFQSDIDSIISSFTGRALYAFRDTLREGYITLDGGIRVGVCGQARYEGGRLVGVSAVSSLLIRFPSAECGFADELCEAFLKSERGILIFAPARGGKTTALRALVKRLGEIGAGRISLVDERCELDCDDFDRLDVDVFRGYKRADGMQIALRVMSPEILAVDELGVSSESVEMVESLLTGVKFIATAHASDFEGLKKRKNLKPFFELDVFDTFAQIFHTDEGFECKILKK